jgi:hypothetical protein
VSRLDDVRARVAAGVVMVAPRDASCYNYPSTSAGPRSHSGGRLHVMVREQAACSGALLVAESAQPAATAPGELLCGRQACYVRWFPARPDPDIWITMERGG